MIVLPFWDVGQIKIRLMMILTTLKVMILDNYDEFKIESVVL